jgi:hypothetical protein
MNLRYRNSILIQAILIAVIILISIASSQQNYGAAHYLRNEAIARNLSLLDPHESVLIDRVGLHMISVENLGVDENISQNILEGFGSPNYRPDALEGEVFELPGGAVSEIPDFENLTLLGLIYVDALNVILRSSDSSFPGIGKSKWFAVRYGGKFNINAEGYYKFRLASDDGSRLVIDDAAIIENDGIHPIQSQSGQVYLENGVHEIEVDYFQADQDAALQLYATPPGGSEEIFRPEYGAVDFYNAIPKMQEKIGGDYFGPSTNISTGENRTISMENASLAANMTELIFAAGLIEIGPSTFREPNMTRIQPILLEGSMPVNIRPYMNLTSAPHNSILSDGGLIPMNYIGFSSSSTGSGGISPILGNMSAKFYSIPGGAKITIDTRTYGKTPSIVNVDPNKKHNYSIEKSGYEPYVGIIRGRQDLVIQAKLVHK